MELKTNSTAGTMESSDIMIMLEPRTEGGIELELTKDAFAEQSIETFNILMRNKAAAKADTKKCTLKIV